VTREWVRPLGFLFTIGWFMALSLLIPTGIGYWLDRGVFNSTPLYTLIGLGVGTVIAFAGLIRMLRRFQAQQNNQDKTKKEDTGQK